MYFHHGNVQWRFPLLFQLVFCGYILIVTPWLPDTPRWLMRHEASPVRGQEVLCKLRNKSMDDPAVRAESDGIMKAIEIESQEEGSWTDLFKDNGIAANKRFFLALGIQFMQQMSGIKYVYITSLFVLTDTRQHCYVLRSHSVPEQSWNVWSHEFVDGSSTPGLVLPCFFLDLVHH